MPTKSVTRRSAILTAAGTAAATIGFTLYRSSISSTLCQLFLSIVGQASSSLIMYFFMFLSIQWQPACYPDESNCTSLSQQQLRYHTVTKSSLTRFNIAPRTRFSVVLHCPHHLDTCFVRYSIWYKSKYLLVTFSIP